MLCKTPKSFNAVDMILAAIRECLAVIQAVMFAQPFQGVVAAEGIGVVDRSFPGMRSDVGHELVGRHSFHNLGVNPAIALQKPEYNAFPGCPSSAPTLPPTAEIRFINLNLSFQFARFKFRHMIDCLTHTLIDARNCLIVNAQICGNPVRRLLLVETDEDGNLSAQLFQRLLFSTGRMPTSNIAAPRSVYLERTAENTLSTPQKVGRTVENVVSSSNHKGILPPRGYDSH